MDNFECAIAPGHQLRWCESAIRKCDDDIALSQSAIALRGGAKVRSHMGPNRIHLGRWVGCEGAIVRRTAGGGWVWSGVMELSLLLNFCPMRCVRSKKLRARETAET